MLLGREKHNYREKKGKAFGQGRKKKQYFVLWKKKVTAQTDKKLNSIKPSVCICVCLGVRIYILKGNSRNQFFVSFGTRYEMKKTHFACYLYFLSIEQFIYLSRDPSKNEPTVSHLF